MNSTTILQETVDSNLGNSSVTSTQAPFLVTPEILIISTEHENSFSLTSFNHPHAGPESLSFILVPVLLILLVALFSGMAIHCIQKRQRLDSLRHTLIPLYTYNRDDDEWGVLLDGSNNRGASRGMEFR